MHQRYQYDSINVILVSFLLTLNKFHSSVFCLFGAPDWVFVCLRKFIFFKVSVLFGINLQVKHHQINLSYRKKVWTCQNIFCSSNSLFYNVSFSLINYINPDLNFVVTQNFCEIYCTNISLLFPKEGLALFVESHFLWS